MKGYGLPRWFEAEFCDKVDIKKYGRSTQDRCSRADRGKNEARRIWAKKARQQGKREIIENLSVS